jgi:hypothetical protein
MSVSFFAVPLIFCFWSTVFWFCLCSQGGQLGLLSKDVTKREEIRIQTLWPNSPVRILQYSLWVVNDLTQYHTYWVSLFSHAGVSLFSHAGVSLFLMPALAAWCYVVRSAFVHNMTIGLSLKIYAIQADLSCVWRISNYLRELLYRVCQDHCTPCFHDPVFFVCFLFKKCNQMAILSSFLF